VDDEQRVRHHRSMAQRFPKLTPETMNAAQREVAAEITAGPRGEVRGPFIALLHNPELARHVQRLGEASYRRASRSSRCWSPRGAGPASMSG
jgi:hypothetical protein